MACDQPCPISHAANNEGAPMKITWFGHSAFRLDFADRVVLIDPFFTGNPAFEGDRDKVSEGVTHILLTHGHGDHVGDTLDLASANGVIVKAPGEPTVYHMGDTDIFGDMALIAEIHKPDVVIAPIGDRFTMGPEVAAMAVRRCFTGLKAVIPCHYASFPPLVPNADRFVAAMDGT